MRTALIDLLAYSHDFLQCLNVDLALTIRKESGYNISGNSKQIPLSKFQEEGVNLTYGQYIEQYITQQPLAAPIYTADISRMLAVAFQMKPDKASSATAVAMKRLMDRRTIPSLRFYQNGIYYRTSVTPFGEMGIDKEQLIAHKYLNADQGYDTGAGLLYRMGLTTQLPNERLIATNAAQDCVRRDEKLNVSICPPKTKITAENKAYLQMLDAMEQMERAPIDAEKPYRVLAEHIQHRNLQYGVLLALAGQYYPQRTLLHLAHTAMEGGLQP